MKRSSLLRESDAKNKRKTLRKKGQGVSAGTQVSGPKDSPCLPPVSSACAPSQLGPLHGCASKPGHVYTWRRSNTGPPNAYFKKSLLHVFVCGWLGGHVYACGHASQDMRGDQRTIFRSCETFRSPSPMWVLGMELT